MCCACKSQVCELCLWFSCIFRQHGHGKCHYRLSSWNILYRGLHISKLSNPEFIKTTACNGYKTYEIFTSIHTHKVYLLYIFVIFQGKRRGNNWRDDWIESIAVKKEPVNYSFTSGKATHIFNKKYEHLRKHHRH